MSRAEGAVQSRLGAADLVRISAFAFGLSGIAGAFGGLLLPIRLLDVAPEELKNSYLGILTFLGLLLAMATQPVVGAFSDAGSGRWGRRPFIVAGSLAACVALVAVGFAPTYAALLAAYLLLQLSSNVAQAPYQAVIPDLVSRKELGRASAAKGIAETLGAIVCVGIITIPMDRYSSGRGAGWLWASLAVLGLMVLVSTALTMAGIRRRRQHGAVTAPPEGKGGLFRVDWRAAPGLPWLLLSRLFAFMAISSVGTFGFYLMQDYFKFERPTTVWATVIMVVAACVLVLAYPAALVSDRVGRKPLLILAAALSAAAFAWLLLAQSYLAVLVAALALGATTAVFYGVNWALATELVPRERSAYYLGLLNFSVAGGSALARLSGTAIDALNRWRDGAGYTSLIAACVAYSLLSGLFLLKAPARRRTPPATRQPKSA
ncbi:MAG: MFS transporter [Chloroflexota bacterium]|nr:MFS transporter [Chloroflexota bacterium]